jgi:hypothetical protein
MKAPQILTIREIRKILFDTDFYAVIGAEEFTNRDARIFLYNIEDQNLTMKVIENSNHLLIY